MRPFDNVVQTEITLLSDAVEGWQDEINRLLEAFAENHQDREILNTQIVCPNEAQSCFLLVVHRSARLS